MIIGGLRFLQSVGLRASSLAIHVGLFLRDRERKRQTERGQTQDRNYSLLITTPWKCHPTVSTIFYSLEVRITQECKYQDVGLPGGPRRLLPQHPPLLTWEQGWGPDCGPWPKCLGEGEAVWARNRRCWQEPSCSQNHVLHVMSLKPWISCKNIAQNTKAQANCPKEDLSFKTQRFLCVLR